MAVSGFQDFWVVGARLFFRRSTDSSDGILDLGVVKSITPNFETERIELDDSRDGVQTRVAEQVTSQDETYDIVLANFSPTNLALVYGATEAVTWSQSAGAVTDVDHVAPALGTLMKLKDGSGNFVYNLASIEEIAADGGAAYTLNTDYKIVDLANGLVEILEGGGITPGETLDVDYTLNAVAASKRLIYPQTAGGTVEGKAIIELGRDGTGTQRSFREADVSLSTNGVNFSPDDYGDFTLTASILSDTSRSVDPAGRLIQPLGNVPTGASG